MAHYQAEFTDNNGDDYKIQIIQASDSSTTYLPFTLGAGGFRLSYNADEENRFHPIIPSEVSFDFMLENTTMETYIQDILDADYGDYFCRIYKSSSIYWVGIMNLENFQREDVYFPYFTTVAANDGLTKLENIDYMDGSELYSGYTNFIDIIIPILKEVGTYTLWGSTDTFFVSSVDWFEKNHTAATYALDPLLQTRVNQSVFYFQPDLSGIDIENNDVKLDFVLEQCALRWGCRLFQADGRFMMLPFNAYKNSTDIYERKYSHDKTPLSSSASNNYQRVGTVLSGGNWQKMPRLKSAYEQYNIMSSVNYWKSDKDLGTEWGIFNLTSADKLTIAFDILSSFTVPSGYSSGEIYPIFQVEARTNTAAYLVANFSPLSGLALIMPDAPRSAGQPYDYYIHTDTNWGSGTIPGTNDKRLHHELQLSGPFNGTLYIKVTCIGYLYANELTLVPTSGTGTFNKIVHSLPTGFSHSHNFENEMVFKNIIGALDNRVYEAIAHAASPNAKGYQYEHPEMVIGSVAGAVNPGLMVNNGTTWVAGSYWGFRKLTGTDTISELNMNEVMRGQEEPTNVFYGSFISNGSYAKAILRDSKVLIPSECTFHAGMAEWEGSWFIDETTDAGGGSTSSSTARRGYVNPSPLDAAQQPITASTASMSLTMYGSAIILTDAQISSGTTTSISTNEFDYAVLFTDDVIKIINPITGDIETMTVGSDVASGDTNISVVSVDLEYSYPPGSAIIMDTQFLLSKTR